MAATGALLSPPKVPRQLNRLSVYGRADPGPLSRWPSVLRAVTFPWIGVDRAPWDQIGRAALRADSDVELASPEDTA